MDENTTTRTVTPAAIGGDATTIPIPSRDVLTEILRDGAQRLLGQAIEAEVAGWIEQQGGKGTSLVFCPFAVHGSQPVKPAASIA